MDTDRTQRVVDRGKADDTFAFGTGAVVARRYKTQRMVEAKSLYERLGGEAAIMAAVDGFYERVLADPVTRPFFAELDMDAQVRKQVSFMSWAMGGPSEYRQRPLTQAHARLVEGMGLNDVHFDHVADALRKTLAELDVPAPEIAEACALIEACRDEVLGRSP